MEASAVVQIRKKSHGAGFRPQSSIDQLDVAQVITLHVVLENAKDHRVRFKADDASFRIDMFEIENCHADVAAAVDDQWVPAVAFKMIVAVQEKILVLDVEFGSSGDLNLVIQ